MGGLDAFSHISAYDTFRDPYLLAAGLAGLGLIVGILTGLFGVGGAFLVTPMLNVLFGVPYATAVGSSLSVVVFSSITGTVKYGLAGDVNLWIAMALLAGSTVGVQIGALICGRLHAKRLKQHFAVVVLLAAVLVAADIIRKIAGL